MVEKSHNLLVGPCRNVTKRERRGGRLICRQHPTLIDMRNGRSLHTLAQHATVRTHCMIVLTDHHLPKHRTIRLKQHFHGAVLAFLHYALVPHAEYRAVGGGKVTWHRLRCRHWQGQRVQEQCSRSPLTHIISAIRPRLHNRLRKAGKIMGYLTWHYRVHGVTISRASSGSAAPCRWNSRGGCSNRSVLCTDTHDTKPDTRQGVCWTSATSRQASVPLRIYRTTDSLQERQGGVNGRELDADGIADA